MSREIAKNFDHKVVENTIYENWEKSGYFKPETNSGGKPFIIAMPPPNVTGKLHIGHALTLTIEDIMTRYHRLAGDASLWIPGMDHAGIATQTVVDKQLKKSGIDKNDIGRDKFIEKIWQWKKDHGDIILKQTRKMGASCDWSREKFTLDEGLNKAVIEAFSSFYQKGLIYRGEYIVNWCPKCQTAISDDEVEHVEQEAKLYFFRYDKNFPITIATTRPETKLGDTAVAVNPSDSRYKKYLGMEFEVNIDGIKRRIKVIADRVIDPKFGSGAVGVTPAHSAIDWRMAEDHKLKVIKVIDQYGRMTKEAGKYAGLKTKEASEKLIQHFQNNRLLEKEENYTNNLSVCYRCGSSIEPMPSLQWFVKMKPLAIKAKEAVKKGKIEIIPKRFEKIYFHWLDNIHDWCISRQLWWGHQIPVFYKKQELNLKSQISNLKNMEDIYVGANPPKDPPAGGENWVQDPDVLDTWFSSALWPFSTLGWPEKTPDYQKFYPTTVMETGYDILFFWVARMIMMGLELTGGVPFKTVYLHGMVRDEKNRKMSKSLGNAIDPLELIEKYGCDALRVAMIAGSTPGQDIAMSEAKIVGYRNFSNKVWNASRFVILRVTEGDLQKGETGEKMIRDLTINKNILTKYDQEILKDFASIKQSTKANIDKFKFSQAALDLYEFFWHRFCDNYIEIAKTQLQSQDDSKVAENTKKILIKILSESLILLHPFIPFVTEAVWQELRLIYPRLSKSIMIAKWPN